MTQTCQVLLLDGHPYLPVSFLLLQLSTNNDHAGLAILNRKFQDCLNQQYIKHLNIKDIDNEAWKEPYLASGIEVLAIPFSFAIRDGMLMAQQALADRHLVAPVQHSLYSPVVYKGKTFLTSQALHHQYREGGGEKYAELKNFNKAIRVMELFDDLLGTGDIVELVYAETLATPTGSELEPVILELFKLNKYNPILLLSPVAQAELTHHLENEANKALAMAANQQFVATNLPPINKQINQDAAVRLAIALVKEGGRPDLVAKVLMSLEEPQKQLG